MGPCKSSADDDRTEIDKNPSVRYGDLTCPNVYLRARGAPYGPLLDTVEPWMMMTHTLAFSVS